MLLTSTTQNHHDTPHPTTNTPITSHNHQPKTAKLKGLPWVAKKGAREHGRQHGRGWGSRR
jgi:hypothetical protein